MRESRGVYRVLVGKHERDDWADPGAEGRIMDLQDVWLGGGEWN
jgi:hypothetical protein